MQLKVDLLVHNFVPLPHLDLSHPLISCVKAYSSMTTARQYIDALMMSGVLRMLMTLFIWYLSVVCTLCAFVVHFRSKRDYWLITCYKKYRSRLLI